MQVTRQDIETFKAAFYNNSGDEADDPVEIALTAVFAERPATNITPPPEPQMSGWSRTSTPPVAGGMYIVGGYVTVGSLRTFERTFASYRATTDSPEWSYKRPEDHRIPMQYWCDMPPHPEHRTASPAPNAYLIAAAPDLLQALIDAVALLEYHHPNPAPNGQINRGRAAIAKAEGNPPPQIRGASDV